MYKAMRSIAVALLFINAQASAQTPPDAGVLRQQIERDKLPPLPPATQPTRPAEPPPIAAPDGASITVKAFRFAGNTLLAVEQLNGVVVPWLGKTVSIAELRQATQAVAAAYREAGWIVRVYLPRQDVTEGVITIQVVEAVFGGVRHEGDEPVRVRLESVLQRFDAQQAVGQPLNAHRLDRALLLADDMPGVSVVGSLSGGAKVGETDLVIKTTDEPLLIGDASIDNHGSRSTGLARGNLAAHLNSPMGIGDLADINVLHTEGSDYGRLAYSLPVGHDGMRIGLNASLMEYELVLPEFKALQGTGDSSSVGALISYPILRSRLSNLSAFIAYDMKGFHNETQTGVQSDYDIANWTLSLSGNRFDRLGGGGANSLTLSYINGRVDQGLLEGGENPALGGHFHKFSYAASRQQVLSPNLSLLVAYSGQYSETDLDTSERFYLGGANGVRAYPASEGGGSRGQTANLELRWRLPNNLHLTGFYDWGSVTNFNTGPSYELKGYGLSATWATASGLSLKVTWAHRDGDNPNPTFSGEDQDGSLHKHRFWFSASQPF